MGWWSAVWAALGRPELSFELGYTVDGRGYLIEDT